MQQCWQISPDKRPSASELINLCTSYSETNRSPTTSIITLENLHEDCDKDTHSSHDSAGDKISRSFSQITEEVTGVIDSVKEETNYSYRRSRAETGYLNTTNTENTID